MEQIAFMTFLGYIIQRQANRETDTQTDRWEVTAGGRRVKQEINQRSDRKANY